MATARFIVARQFKMFRISIIQRSYQMHYKKDACVDGPFYGDIAKKKGYSTKYLSDSITFALSIGGCRQTRRYNLGLMSRPSI